MTELVARASIAPEDIAGLRKKFNENGRSRIVVNVKLPDTDGRETFKGFYEWFAQGLVN